MPGAPAHNRRRTTRHDLLAIAALFSAVFLGTGSASASNTVAAVSWDHDPRGRTVVTVVCTREVDPSSIRTYPLVDPPREVIVLEGVPGAVEPGTLTIGDRRVSRVRLVHRPGSSPPELLVVLDLAGETREPIELRRDGARLKVVVGEASTPVRTAPVTGEDGAAKTRVSPAPAPSPQPSATPPPTPAFPPSATPATISTNQTAPAVTPPTPTATSEVPSPVVARAVLATPTPIAEPVMAKRITDVSASLRGDGSTLLLITADGKLPQGCARTLEVDGDPPRLILTIRGVSAPDLPRTLEIDDANIRRIRLIHDAETSQVELHLVLHLTSGEVGLTEMKQVGANLVVRLGSVEAETGRR
jgi:hypothetical protein